MARSKRRRRPRKVQQSAAPDLGPILEIHRADDSYIRFSKAEGSSVMPFAHVQAGDLQKWFPEFREELAMDSYFSLNGFYRDGTAKAAHLRYLNVAYADCDYHKAGTTRGAAMQTIIDAQDEGLLPAASIIADSGRGLWCFYLLRNPKKPDEPERVFHDYVPEKLARYRKVQMALHQTLKSLEPSVEPDPNARDASRVARVPGSINSKSGRQVKYWIQADESVDGQPRGFAYSLRDLENHFQIPGGKLDPEVMLTWPSEKRIPANRGGYIAMHRSRLADLELLAIHRRGFQEGTREAAMWIYAMTLRGYRDPDTDRPLTESEIRDRVVQLASECEPPLEADRALHHVRASQKYRLMSDEKIIERLQITDEELELLASIKAGRVQRKAGPKGARRERKIERQAKIAELIETRFDNQKPSTRHMAAALTEEGIDVTHVTVSTDYHDMALTGPQLEIEYATPLADLVVGSEIVHEAAQRTLADHPEIDNRTAYEVAEYAIAGMLELVAAQLGRQMVDRREPIDPIDLVPNLEAIRDTPFYDVVVRTAQEIAGGHRDPFDETFHEFILRLTELIRKRLEVETLA